jgi:SAM-dependent methyltransferase
MTTDVSDRASVTDQLYILPASLLETHRHLVTEFRSLASRVGVAPGWHYPLDLVWAANLLGVLGVQGGRVLDAGAGIGLMQWWLAAHGAEVLSVDRDPRHFSRRMRELTTVRGSPDPLPSLRYSALRTVRNVEGVSLAKWAWRSKRAMRDLVLGDPPAAGVGTVIATQSDLRDLSFVESDSVDAVVSISSLEHNTLDDLPVVIAELLRVLRPGGRLIATVGASKSEDWFHEPSRGWCFTEDTLRSVFDLPADCPSNYHEYDTLMADLIACRELADNLAPFYFRSGNNGMPWGRWNPVYQSVGVVKTKPAATASLGQPLDGG